MEQTNERKDAKGNIISKLNKEYHVSFKVDFAETIEVESYKEYNVLNDKNEYINNIDNEYEDNSEEDKEEENDEEKFDINKYEALKLDKMPNHDPNGFSRTKCIII